MNEQIKSLIQAHKQALDGVGHYLEKQCSTCDG